MEIRLLTKEDIDIVRQLDYQSTLIQYQQMFNTTPPFKKRTRSNFYHWLNTEPQTAIVAVENGNTIIGYAIGHAWGTTGWIGPITVSSEWQGRHVGQHLINTVVEQLRNRNCLILGLEASPCYANPLNFFMNAGFNISDVIFSFGKAAGNVAVRSPSVKVYDMTSKLTKAEIVSIKQIIDSAEKGCDYFHEMASLCYPPLNGRLAIHYSENDDIDGFLVFKIGNLRDEDSLKLAIIDFYGVRGTEGSDATAILFHLLNSVEAYLAKLGVNHIIIRCLARSTKLIADLREFGFRTSQEPIQLRMEYAKGFAYTLNEPKYHFASWSA